MTTKTKTHSEPVVETPAVDDGTYAYTPEERTLLRTIGVWDGESTIPQPADIRTVFDGFIRGDNAEAREHALASAQGSIHVEGTTTFVTHFLRRLHGPKAVERVEAQSASPFNLPGVQQDVVATLAEATGIDYRKLPNGIALVGRKINGAFVVLLAPASDLGLPADLSADALIAKLAPEPEVRRGRGRRASVAKRPRTQEQIEKDRARMAKYRAAAKARTTPTTAEAESVAESTPATESTPAVPKPAVPKGKGKGKVLAGTAAPTGVAAGATVEAPASAPAVEGDAASIGF